MRDEHSSLKQGILAAGVLSRILPAGALVYEKRFRSTIFPSWEPSAGVAH